MPILAIECPDCGHRFEALVLDGTTTPAIWHCSRCGGVRAQPRPDIPPRRHPWEEHPDGRHTAACACG
jgi:uncharacterized Zn finger protein